MTLKTFEKQPSERQDYDIDYTAYVVSMGESAGDAHTIDAIEGGDPGVTCAPGLTMESFEIFNGVAIKGVPSTFIKIWTSGGTTGGNYKITARIRTAGGRTHEREIRVKVKET